MNQFFSPEKTGETLQRIAKWAAIVTIVLTLLGMIISLVEASSYYEPDYGPILTTAFSVIVAEVFACLVLHGFGVLVDSSYQQKVQAEKQTALLRQMAAAAKPAAPAAPVATAKPAVPAKPAAPVKPAAPAPEREASEKRRVEVDAAPAAAQLEQPNLKAMDILGVLLSMDDQESRLQYLQRNIDTADDEQIRALCRQAIGMTDEQIIELISTLN